MPTPCVYYTSRGMVVSSMPTISAVRPSPSTAPAPVFEYITTSQAAELLGIGVSRTLRLIGAGRIAAEKVGKQWMIRPEALEAVKDRKPGQAGWLSRKSAG